MDAKRYIDRLSLFVESGYKLNLSSEQLHVLMIVESMTKRDKKLVQPSDIANVTLMNEKQVEVIIGELISLKYLSIESNGKDIYYTTNKVVDLLLAPTPRKQRISFKELFEAKLKRELKDIELEIVSGWQEENVDFEKMSKILLNVQFDNDQIPFSLINELLIK